MNRKFDFENRKYTIAAIAIVIVVVYAIRLLSLQLVSEEYQKNADSNAFLKRVEFPARGVISDRKGKILVYNQSSYDIMVIMQEQKGHIDTLDFCRTVGITKQAYIKRMAEIKDYSKNPGYSRYTQQTFMTQLTERDYSILREKLYRFPGFYIRKRAIRQYNTDCGAHVLGDLGEVSWEDLHEDDYYQSGDYIGKTGVERSYEKVLRGEKGVEVLLRDSRGRIKGSYQNGKYDVKPTPGKDITLTIDEDLQALGERLLEGKIGAIVAIEPSTGEVLAMVSSPSFNPKLMSGRGRGKVMSRLSKNPWRPLLNRTVQGQYPPGSTFKTTQGLTFLSEGIVHTGTSFPCVGGFKHKGVRVRCHGHPSPLSLVAATATSCNGYFCWGLYNMISNRTKYPTKQEAMNTWRDYMVSMGFGYRLGIDLPGEKRGLIPNAEFYDDAYNERWNGLTIVSISIGQGEVTATPLQIANLGATIANRGYYITPHVVKSIKGEDIDPVYTERHYTKARRSAYDAIIHGMRAAVTGGTCKSANTAAYMVCGKTGTAQNRGHDHSIFIGFAPMYNPKIALAVYVENGGFGATNAVPMASVMFEQYMRGGLSESYEALATNLQQRRIVYGEANR
ncbi:MAG: penicillin-binding protein 2 [Bacteroidaceae bacterium]|nr:penicillin-binding protein 2 [Bacteroidaceae bacterium]